jgi:pimeloyl-ACP methyl ester carboxylesterase
MKTRILLFFCLLGTLSGCRLDDNLFNTSEKLTEYRLDNYTGERDFTLDASYAIPDSLIHLFSLNTPDGETIYAIYIGDTSRIATDTVILYCHGNKWHMDFYWQRAKLLANTGGRNRFGLLFLDYRGYGLSSGKPTEEGLYTDVNTCMEWLQSKGLSDERLVLYGFSMGTAPATRLTAEPRSMKPSRLILEAPFASAETMVQDAAVLAIPGTYVTNLRINNAEEIKKVRQPLLWLHGTQDNFLSISTHGEIVFKNHSGIYKQAARVQGADHGNVPNTLGYADYSALVLEFITR